MPPGIKLAKTCFSLLSQGIWHLVFTSNSIVSFNQSFMALKCGPWQYLSMLCPLYSVCGLDAVVWLWVSSPSQPLQLIQTRRLCFFGHVATLDTSLDITRALRVSVHGMSEDWRRPPGRPCLTPGYEPRQQTCSHPTLDWLQRGDRPRTEHVGSILWKLLCSSQWHARDNDDGITFKCY